MSYSSPRARTAIAAAVALLTSAPLAGAGAPVVRPAVAAAAVPSVAPGSTTAAPAAQSLGSGFPMRFEVNAGQTDARAKFVARTSGYALFLTGEEAVFSLRGAAPAPAEKSAVGTPRLPAAAPTAVLRMKPVGADPSARVTGEDLLPGTSSYFVGNDPSRWRTKVPAYAKVRYENAYPGVDLVYYGGEGGLEFDFAVAPGADASAIRLAFDGAESVSVDGGELVVRTAAGALRQKAPVAFQPGAGGKRAVSCRYAIGADGTVGFELGGYDASAPLVIDPVILFSTLLGGSGVDGVGKVLLDADGYIYFAGGTTSADFPVTNDSHGGRANGRVTKSFIAKMTPDASSLVFAVTLGGSYADAITGFALDASGDLYVAGVSYSPDFPTVSPIQTDPDGVFPDGSSDRWDDGFATKLSADGSSLIYSTYVCGSGADELLGMALGGDGSLYVTGSTASRDFPTVNAFQPEHADDHGDEEPVSTATDMFVTKINPGGTAYEYSTYLGGTQTENARGIAVDGSGAVYIGGGTNSTDYPTRNPIKGNLSAGIFNGLITKLNSDGSLAYSTFLGGSTGDEVEGIAVDADGAAYVVGTATSTDFPVRNSLYPRAVQLQGFAAKIAPSGSALDYCTYLDTGQINGGAYGVTVDANKNAYVSGSAYFPSGYDGEQDDIILTELNPDATAVVFEEIIGGADEDYAAAPTIDASGAIYLGGTTWSADFPTTLTPPLDPQRDSTQGFVMKLGDPAFDMVARDDKTHDLFRTLAKNPTDRNYGYWEYRVAATGQILQGRAGGMQYDASTGLKMQDASKKNAKLKATFDYAADKAVVVFTNARTGARRKIVDRENSRTPMP